MNNVLLEQSYIVLTEVAKKFDANTSAILNKLYPKVAERLKSPSGKAAYKKCVSEFLQKRSEALYDTLPCARMLFGESDAQDIFKALNIPGGDVANIILQTYYGNEPNFSPKAAKDEVTVLLLCVVRYFMETKQMKEAELATIHLSFSGKFYPSLHYRSFPTVLPARHVMEYTVNNVLTTKFDLVQEGSVIGAVRKISGTWLTTYGKDRMKKFADEDVVYVIQQLYSRIGSFIKNIAEEYYKVYEDQDNLYIAYAGDDLSEENYRLSDSDSLKINRWVDKAMTYMTNNGVDYAICRACSDVNITTNEIKSIMESLLGDPQATVKLRELVMLMIITYQNYSGTKDKDVTNPKFITYSIAAKPNAKQKELVRMQQLVEELLSENSPAYIRRRSRASTKNSFEKALRTYLALNIHNANR